jgi:Family of unknown function (DUF6152)/Bacterial Ig domain
MACRWTPFIALLAAWPLGADHNSAAEFDITKPVTLTGVVIQAEWINPHAWLHMDVKDAHSNVVTWLVEIAGPNSLKRGGVTKESFKQASEVSVEVWLAKDGARRAVGRQGGTLTLPSGQKVILPNLIFTRSEGAIPLGSAACCPAISPEGGLSSEVPGHNPPIVNLTAPAAHSTLTGTVVVSANAPGSGIVAGVQFKVDGNNIGVEVPNLPYSTVLDTTTLINGTHIISATARGANDTAFSIVTVKNSETLNNPIKIENAQTGTSAWKLTTPATDGQIEGYASLTSVNIGGQIKLFVNTSDPSYTMDIYRMGWYNGAGARELSGPVTLPGMVQPVPTIDSTTGLIECHWTNPYVLSVPTTWVSGVYLVKLTALTSGKQSYIIFDVRDDARPSDIVFQSSVTTYEAYNPWGGKSLYPFNSTNGMQARKVSFNRPYGPGYGSAITGVGAGHFLTTNAPVNYGSGALEGWEYNMVRWLERNGYDVTYLTDLDVHQNSHALFNHRVFLSVGHDEYWSWDQRQNVENARDHGINLAFFAANVCYWQIRLEPDYDDQVDRTMVGYKESAFTTDPYALDSDLTNDKYITTYWRQNNTKPPEDALVGVAYFEDPVNGDMVVSDASGWIFQSTGLSNGSHLTGLLGYEVDRTLGNAPRNLRVLASSPTPSGMNATMTLYTAASGAQVFATGSMQWAWGMDNDYFMPNLRPVLLSTAAQQMVVNILTRFTHWNRPVDRRK